jgi:neutral ceramidase
MQKILGCAVLFFLSIFNPVRSDSWHIGTARVDITPADTLWMAGYAARTLPGQDVMHPLWAKAMVIADAEDHRGILITTDLLGFPKELSRSIRDKLCARFGVDYTQIILSASHTHSGPVLKNGLRDIYPLSPGHRSAIERYSEELENKILSLVEKAWFGLNPVQLYAENGVVRFQVNRRNNDSRDLDLQSDLNGPNDYAVPVLSVFDRDSSLIATAFGYACHPTVLNGYEWSGDYPGFAQIALEKQFPGMTAMFFQGCGADQNPLPRRSQALAEQYGRELAAATSRTLQEGDKPLAPVLKTGYSEIPLGLNELPDSTLLVQLLENGASYQIRWARRMLKERTAGHEQSESYAYPVQIWTLGSQLLLTMGGEVVVDYAIALKRIFGPDIFVMGYANDVMGYIPSVRILREGGYEGASSQIVYGLPSTWQADIEQRILGGFIELANSMKLSMPKAPLWHP